MPFTKPALRAQALARRKGTPAEASAAFAAHLAAEGLALVERLRPGIVSAYFPLDAEPSTCRSSKNLAAPGSKPLCR